MEKSEANDVPDSCFTVQSRIRQVAEVVSAADDVEDPSKFLDSRLLDSSFRNCRALLNVLKLILDYFGGRFNLLRA